MLLEKLDSDARWWDGIAVVPGLARNSTDLIAAAVAVNVAALAVPVMLMQVYDRVIPNQAGSTLIWLAVGAFSAILLEGWLRWARAVMSGWMGARFEHLVGCEAIERILGSRIEEFEKDGIGVHLDRLGVVATLKGFYVGQMFQSALDLPFVFLYFAAIAYVGGWIVLFPVLAGVALVGLVGLARARFHGARTAEYGINDRRYNFVIEALGGLHLIKSQAMEEQLLRRYERLQGSAAATTMSVGFWNMMPPNVGASVAQFTTFGMMILGAWQVIEGNLTVGGMSACVMLAGRSLQPIQSAVSMWFRFSDVTISRERLSQLHGLSKEVSENCPAFPGDIDGSIELQDVSFRYGEGLPLVLDHINLRVPPGRTIAITGSGAAGTTSLLYLMMGRLRPTSGRLLIDDYDMAEWDHSDLRGRIDYVPANGVLFKGTILDNIAMFNASLHEQALAAAGMLGLDEPVGLLPMGYETPVDSQSSNFLPSGLIQRICLARALVQRPRILLLDKTASSMDHDSEEMFLWLISRLKGRCTMVIVGNQLNLLGVADEVWNLSGGHLSLVTSVEEVCDGN
ncbi:putative hlyB(ABC transporter, ATP-binding protein) [Magnetospirillum sp. SS-4]|nr:putative hlyB(ABC transporter, ATP-binding protein) [Magnetospirillum sp. SS-4]